MKKIKIIIFLLFLLSICFACYKLNIRHKYHKINAIDIVDSDCVPLEPIDIIYLENLSLENFTSTGLTYDSKNKSFWIADHGTKSNDQLRIIEISSDLKTLLTIVNIEKYNNSDSYNLQGIAYDSLSDSIWLALGNIITEIDKSGHIINEIQLSQYSQYQFNGICYDDKTDTLWILCFNKYLLHTDKNGNLIERINSDFSDQDMICIHNGFIYMTVGADYITEDNYCIVFNPENNSFKNKYQLLKSYAVEGIYFSDDKFYVINDGMFHNATIPKTYISVYEYQ